MLTFSKLAVAACLCVLCAVASATPFVFRDIERKPLPGKASWPAGTTINVTMDDIVLDPASTGDRLDYLSFVNSVAPLGPEQASFVFSFDSSVAPGGALAYASGDEFFPVIAPARLPAPDTLALLALALIGTGATTPRLARAARS